MMPFAHDESKTTRDDSNASAPPTYTSYAGHVYFQLRMDTWYYSELEDVGRIHLGTGPITRDSGVAQALGTYITGFKEAFAGLFRLDSRDSYFGVPIASEQFAEQFAAQLPERKVIDGVIAHFDVWAAVRDSQGAIQHQWITGVGNLWLSARGKTQQGGKHPDTLPSWSAHVMVGVGSLFRPDNQQALRHARTLWKDLRQRYPDSMSFADAQESEGLEESSIITLAEVPPGTPSDNRDLSALNLPRLKAAVARWEQIIGHPFEWAESFTRLE